jgi:hypothetical protein
MTVTDERPKANKGVAGAKADSKKAAGVRYRCGAKPLRVGEKVYKPGQLIPDAASWTRVEAWERARRLERVEG